MGADITFARLYSRGKNGGTQVVYYIPASSFKGALRSAASRVAASYTSGKFTSCGQVEPKLIEQAHRSIPGNAGLCSICRLFGSPGLTNTPSVFFEDLLPIGGGEASVITRSRIEDSSLRVMEHGLYKSEAVSDMEFKGKIYYVDEVKELLPLLLLGLAELRLDRFGRRSAIDIRIAETGDLKHDLEKEWHGLLAGLEEWLWSGDV